jgi:hypothetical protein
MIKIEIGAIVDWIDQNCRFRGLIVDFRTDHAICVVIGSASFHTQHISRLVPVAPSEGFLRLCNP